MKGSIGRLLSCTHAAALPLEPPGRGQWCEDCGALRLRVAGGGWFRPRRVVQLAADVGWRPELSPQARFALAALDKSPTSAADLAARFGAGALFELAAADLLDVGEDNLARRTTRALLRQTVR